MGDNGYVVWPEGQPELARFVASWWRMQWLMLGPMGIRASLRCRRMSRFWPAPANLDPAKLAAGWEARVDELRGDIVSALRKFSGDAA